MPAESVERLATESAEARTRIAATIDEIQDRLDPRRILSDVMGKAGDNSRQALASAKDTVKDHPVAIGVAIAAVGLALLARNKLSNARIDMGDGMDSYTDYDDGLGYEEAPIVSDGDPRARALVERAGERVDANPFVSIVLGLAAGAALGALFPASEAERRVVNGFGGKLGDAAKRAADAVGERFQGSIS